MKRLLTTIMAIFAIFAICAINSCRHDDPVNQEDPADQEESVTDEDEEDDDVNNGPVVSWASNPNFDVLDITDTLDANITVTASAGIDSFVVTVDSEVLEETLLSLGMTTELDLINNETVIQILDTVTEGQLPTGSALAGQTEVNFDISSLVFMINELTTEESYHSFILNVTDTEGKSARDTCTFRRVGVNSSEDDSNENPEYAEPTITWEDNEDFSPVDLYEDMSVNITINAPARISSFVFTVNSEVLEEYLYSKGVQTMELDLINDEIVIQVLNTVTEGQLPTGSDLAGQTEVNFDISSLVLMINDLTTEESFHSFILDVTDTEGKSARATCIFHRVKENNSGDNPDGPTITWEGNENFSTVELYEEMSVNITINVPAGVESLVVDVTSTTLNSEGISSIDFVNPGTMSNIVSAVLGNQDITTAVELSLDFSSLVSRILNLEPDDNSYHIFTIKLTDNAGNYTSKIITFRYIDTSVSLEMSDVDLWKNTAVLKVSGPHESVAYRVASTGEWISLTGTDGVYNISPVWNSSTNDANLPVYTPKEGSGIFAGNTYEFMIDDQQVDYSYTAGAGDVIPNGDMSSWSTKSMPKIISGSVSVPYPNASGNSFWDSGNNYYAQTLCQAAEGTAYLKAGIVLYTVLSPGNMFTGEFSMSGTTGTASMGQQYSWTARPKAFKFDYKAYVGTINYTGSNDPERSSYRGKQDVVHVYAAVVDWSGRHAVTSGVTTVSGVWDPTTQTSVDEGKILGYASFETSTSTDSFTEVEIPFVWYDYESKPTGNYTIVISCSTSKRGDYLTGCSSNYMYLDNFEWVY